MAENLNPLVNRFSILGLNQARSLLNRNLSRCATTCGRRSTTFVIVGENQAYATGSLDTRIIQVATLHNWVQSSLDEYQSSASLRERTASLTR